MANDWDDMAAGYCNQFVDVMWGQIGLEPDEAGEMVVLDFGCGTGLLADRLRSVVSRVVCVDASPKMIEKVQSKIVDGKWSNVNAFVAGLACVRDSPTDTQRKLEELRNSVDLVAASSVLGFIPKADLSETMKKLGSFLKKGGIFCHSDWPISSKHPDGFSKERANEVYAMAGLEVVATDEINIVMGDETTPVFFGVARKP